MYTSINPDDWQGVVDIGSTLVSELIAAYATFSEEERTALGMRANSLAEMTEADTRGRNLRDWFNRRINAVSRYADAGQA
ncbi:hypothetical protein HNP55_001162 [Paucibacter oligotrophus]|uniref:Uncharacterized protein n=1 Tax=Roseateles oligotrophus TaxID=1769250 RepID=A0A840LBD0_9BURK|nr:hypothetical protein [Roseateles oligotrophus]